jgi:hypothetical protein
MLTPAEEKTAEALDTEFNFLMQKNRAWFGLGKTP